MTLLFGVLKFPNFAVGAMMTLAAYMVFALNVQLGWPLTMATAVVAVAFGGSADRDRSADVQAAARSAARSR